MNPPASLSLSRREGRLASVVALLLVLAMLRAAGRQGLRHNPSPDAATA
ncbi:MAG: hypothetical protein QM586_10205 [Xenophilus sp.]